MLSTRLICNFTASIDCLLPPSKTHNPWEQVTPKKALLLQPRGNKDSPVDRFCAVSNGHPGHGGSPSVHRTWKCNEPSYHMALYAEIASWQACSNRTQVHELTSITSTKEVFFSPFLLNFEMHLFPQLSADTCSYFRNKTGKSYLQAWINCLHPPKETRVYLVHPIMSEKYHWQLQLRSQNKTSLRLSPLNLVFMTQTLFYSSGTVFWN